METVIFMIYLMLFKEGIFCNDNKLYNESKNNIYVNILFF